MSLFGFKLKKDKPKETKSDATDVKDTAMLLKDLKLKKEKKSDSKDSEEIPLVLKLLPGGTAAVSSIGNVLLNLKAGDPCLVPVGGKFVEGTVEQVDEKVKNKVKIALKAAVEDLEGNSRYSVTVNSNQLMFPIANAAVVNPYPAAAQVQGETWTAHGGLLL